MRRIRILLADDHPVVRQGLQWLISSELDMEVVGEAADGIAAVELARTRCPDVVLLDLVMPRQDGIWAIDEILRERPTTSILVLTSFTDDEKVTAAIRHGALGYLIKDSSPEKLLNAIRDVAAGGSPLPPAIARTLVRQLHAPASPPPVDPLTAREREVLALIAEGCSNQQIADVLVVSERTARCHVSNILHKLRLTSRTQAALYAVREGLLPAKTVQPSA
jgi:NarL family two-component system response regulator LiaR